MTFNEDSRVKIPAIVHLTRLGYTYLPKTSFTNLRSDTNIFKDQFKAGLSKINDLRNARPRTGKLQLFQRGGLCNYF